MKFIIIDETKLPENPECSQCFWRDGENNRCYSKEAGVCDLQRGFNTAQQSLLSQAKPIEWLDEIADTWAYAVLHSYQYVFSQYLRDQLGVK